MCVEALFCQIWLQLLAEGCDQAAEIRIAHQKEMENICLQDLRKQVKTRDPHGQNKEHT